MPNDTCPATYRTLSGKTFICLKPPHEERHGHYFRESQDHVEVTRLIVVPGGRR